MSPYFSPRFSSVIAKRILFSKPSRSHIAHFQQIGLRVSVLFSLAKILQCGDKKHKSLSNCLKGFFNKKLSKFCHILRKKGSEVAIFRHPVCGGCQNKAGY
jgi:hypothetical protein